MKQKRCAVETEIQMIATASLNKSVADDLKQPDRDLGELLEDTKRNDGKGCAGDNPDSNKQA